MPFDRPDLKTLITRAVTDINSRFEGTFNRLRRKVNAVFGRVLAGLAHGLYGYLHHISEQILPDTQEKAVLLRCGTQLGVTYKDEKHATGSITCTGNDGAEMEALTLWQREDGTEYQTLAQASIVSGSLTVAIKAVVAGSAGNTEAGTAVYVVSPIDGIDPTAVVASAGLTGGVDPESIDAYRQRVLERTGTFYTGANRAIYEKWAKEVPGVTRAWGYERTPAAGSVTLLFVCDDQDGGIIPDAAKITEVEDYLEEHTDPITGELVGRGVNVTLVVSGPVAQSVDFTILPSPNTSAVQAAIAAELEDLLRREAVPGGTILLSHIREAISLAAGEDDYTLTAPAADVTRATGAISVMGNITWT